MRKEIELLCVGNALTDIFATVNTSDKEQVFSRFDLNHPVQHIEMEELSAILSKLPDAGDMVVTSGGGAANVAKIAGLLGTKVCFTGTIGQDIDNGAQADKYGQLFIKDLSAAGVELKLQLKPCPTGICLYLKAADETRIASSPSAALELSEDDINTGDVRRARVVVIDGFMLGRPGLVKYILDQAEQAGTVAAIDLSSPGIAMDYAAEITDYANRYSLILFMNENEAAAYCKKMRNEEWGMRNGNLPLKEADSFFKSLTAGKPFPIIVVKLGDRGAVFFSSGDKHHAETQAVSPMDSTGAGDAFCAGFLSAWVHNKPLSECAALGNQAARIVLDVMGTQVERKQFCNLHAST